MNVKGLNNLARTSGFSLVHVWRCVSDKTNLFKSTDTADAYARYRPAYNSDVFEAIASFCQETEACDFSLAVDVGCGPGLSTVPLTKRFKRVVGLDVSQAQLDRAPKDIPSLSFKVGPAEDLSFLEDGCVDLVTAATAVHWMNPEKLYPEVERVLKPGGAFVTYGYTLPTFDEPKAQAIFKYDLLEALKPYWPAEVTHPASRYVDFNLPFPGWRRHDALSQIEESWTLDEFVGFIKSLSAFHRYISLNPVSNLMDPVRQRLMEVYQDVKDTEGERRLKLSWPVFMLMGHKPLS